MVLLTQFYLLLIALHCIMNTCIISLHHFNFCMASFFIRVDAANEAVYELVAEPGQEPQAEEQQEETVEHASEEVANPVDLQGKPRSITLNFSIQYYYLSIVHYVVRSCMEP